MRFHSIASTPGTIAQPLQALVQCLGQCCLLRASWFHSAILVYPVKLLASIIRTRHRGHTMTGLASIPPPFIVRSRTVARLAVSDTGSVDRFSKNRQQRYVNTSRSSPEATNASECSGWAKHAYRCLDSSGLHSSSGCQLYSSGSRRYDGEYSPL